VKRLHLRRVACLATMTLACCAAAESLAPVSVSGLRNPVDKSYRKMLHGMDLFEKSHAIAPAAPLRFKLLPRGRDTEMDGVVLKIVGNTMSIPVPIAADHTFELTRNDKALAEDAAVLPNRKAGSMTWRAEIRTPGLPPNTRRLGDLRLECQVGMEAGLVSDNRSVLDQLRELLHVATDNCNANDPHYLFFSDRPLFGVTMRAGPREWPLSIDHLYAGIGRRRMSEWDVAHCDCQVLLDRTYYLPLGDHSWPDGTLVELEYIEDGDVSRAAARIDLTMITAPSRQQAIRAGQSSKTDVIAALGSTKVLHFDSGFEVWIYQLDDNRAEELAMLESLASRAIGGQGGLPQQGGGGAEFIVLFAPSGVVAKTRVRPKLMVPLE